MLQSKKLSRSSTISMIGFAMCGLVLIAIGCYWSLSASANLKAGQMAALEKGRISTNSFETRAYVAPAATITVNDWADGAPVNNGHCTLREALINANNNNQSGSTDCDAGSGADTIIFNFITPIYLTSALPDITDSLTIAGPGADQLTVRRDTGGDYRIFNIPNSGLSITISGLTISNGKANGFGGGIFSRSNLLLTNCAIVNNEASGLGSGGGVSLQSADGSFTGCTFNGNVALIVGAGVHFLGDGGHTLTVTNCTVSGNTITSVAGVGGGIFNASSSGNSTLEVINSTIANNAASQAGGGGIHTRTLGAGTTATTRLRNTIVGNNSLPNLATDIISGGGPATVTSLGNNLASDNGGGFLTGPGDQINKDPKLSPLANNGGPTQTHALLPGSPAIDTGTATGAPSTDQRGVSRPKGGGVDIGAFESLPPTVVNSLADGLPQNNGQCTLREALINANNNDQSGSTDCAAGFGPDTITFSVTGTINLTSALPNITDSLNIAGPGANQLTVRRDTGGDYRIFTIINGGSTVGIAGLTITNGRLFSNDGGGIYNQGSLTLTNCAVTDNLALVGGGIMNNGSLTMTGCTLSGNIANNNGGGLKNNGGAVGNATANLTNCTFSANSGIFGVIATEAIGVRTATTTLTNCTVSANSGGSGAIININSGGGTNIKTQLRNTLVAGNNGVNFNIAAGTTLTSLGGNFDSDGSSGFTDGLTGTAQFKLDAKLGPLGNNGGPTQTHALLFGSPAIDAGTATGAPTTDQRGVSRPMGGGVDIGAFESLPPTVVNSLADGTPANNGQCTLREALINANNNNQSGSTDCAAGSGADTITFSVTGTINLTGALPDITDSLTIVGPGANLLTVRRNTGGDYRIFNIPSGQTVTFTGLTIANGSVPTDVGGGILNSGSLTLTNCAVTGNLANGAGGIMNNGGLIMTGCTISGNIANFDGGGLYNLGNVAANLTNCTFSGNSGTSNGITTAAFNEQTATTTLTNCTVSANSGGSGVIRNINFGGGTNVKTQLRNTLVAGNNGVNFNIDAGTTLTSLGNNLDSDGTSGFTNGVGGNLVGTAANKLNAKLGPLGNNGGPTQTHLLLCGSPAINAGSNTGAPSTDQRGFVRPVGGTTDIGAVEGDYSLSLSATALPKGRVNTTYPTQTLSATGGTAPYVFTAVTPLPGGLTLGANGAINGTPTTAVSNFSFTVTAVDAVGKQGCRDYLLTIDPACPTITINPATLPNGQLGQSYNQQLTQSGGAGVIAWSFTGNLPGNVTLNPTTGLISGAPTTSGTFNFSVTATDVNGCASAPKAYSLVIASCPAITINPTTLPSGQIGLQYSQQLTQTGGTGTLMWSFAGGLPTGVTMNLTTGLISGKPTVSGTFDFSVAVKDANGCMSSTPKSYSLVIAPCPTITITPASLSPGTVNIQFTQLLTASGGTAPYTFSVNAGSTLPPGLSLSGDTLLGSPTTASSFPFTIKVTDAAGCTGTQSYTLVVNPAITSNGLQFYPLTKPLRLLDTRPANERPGGAFDLPGVKLTGELNGGIPRTQNARVTFDGLTIPANAKAIVGTATVINYPGAGQYTGTGNVTFYPSNKPKPEVSNLNYAANQTISNGFTVALGDDGAFKIFSYSDVHLVVDVVGYYAPPGAGGLYFHPLPRPVRALETRPELFYPGCETPRTKLLAGSTRLLQGRFGCDGITIPSSAQALVGNLTSVNANANGEAEVYAGDVAPLPLANTLSYVSTQAIPNAFVTRLSGTGSYNLYVSQMTDMLVDLTGYFSAEANDINGQGLLLTLLETPIRKLETRPELFYPGCITPRAPLAGGSETVIPALGTCGGVTIPASARALIGNATVVNFVSQGSGNVTLYPTAANRPEASNLNYVANQVIPNAFTVALSPDGKFTVYVFSTIHLLIDVSGYYAP